MSHPDRKPLGDIPETLLAILGGKPELGLEFAPDPPQAGVDFRPFGGLPLDRGQSGLGVLLRHPARRDFAPDMRPDPLEMDLQLDLAHLHRGLRMRHSARFDLRPDPGEDAPGYPDRYFIRYAETEVGEGAGSLVAPFTGNHGWYWLNIEDFPVTITLEARGFYERIEELGRSYQ